MRGALTSERRAVPPCPSMFQRHARDSSHQIQLSGPHISERCHELAEAAIGIPVEVPRSGDLLVRTVNEVVDADVVFCHCERNTGVAWRQLTKTGHAALDQEATTWAKMASSVLKARDLFVLRCQVHDRVEDQIHEGELTFHACTAMSPSIAAMSLASGFDRSTSSMSADNSIPATGTPWRPKEWRPDQYRSRTPMPLHHRPTRQGSRRSLRECRQRTSRSRFRHRFSAISPMNRFSGTLQLGRTGVGPQLICEPCSSGRWRITGVRALWPHVRNRYRNTSFLSRVNNGCVFEPLQLPTCSVHDTLAERGSSAGGGDSETPISRACCCRRAVRTSRSCGLRSGWDVDAAVGGRGQRLSSGRHPDDEQALGGRAAWVLGDRHGIAHRSSRLLVGWCRWFGLLLR